MSTSTPITEIIEIRQRRLADIRGYIAEHEKALAEWREEEAAAIELLADAEKRAKFRDDRGRCITIGDEVMVIGINSDRGAEMWMNRGRVVGFGRTRVEVQFAERNGTSRVGAEHLRVVTA